jgi:hypothetical protein
MMPGLPELPPLNLGLLDLDTFSALSFTDLSLSLSLPGENDPPSPPKLPVQETTSITIPLTASDGPLGARPASAPATFSTPGHEPGTHAFSPPSARVSPARTETPLEATFSFPPTPAPATPARTPFEVTFAFPPTPTHAPGSPAQTEKPLEATFAFPPTPAGPTPVSAHQVLPPTPTSAFDLPPTPDSPLRHGTPAIRAHASADAACSPVDDAAWFSPAGSVLCAAISPGPLSSLAFAMSVARARESASGKEKALPLPPSAAGDVPKEVSSAPVVAALPGSLSGLGLATSIVRVRSSESGKEKRLPPAPEDVPEEVSADDELFDGDTQADASASGARWRLFRTPLPR